MIQRKLKKLSNNEVVGDSVTHFFKSRAVIRSTHNSKYTNATKHIPKKWNALPVAYDIWWDTWKQKDDFGIPVLSGFSYTDFLSNCIYFRPANSVIGYTHFRNIISIKPTIDTIAINKIISGLDDKYCLNVKTNKNNPSDIVFLPGTNLLERNYLDYDAVREIVSNGGQVKPHPLTTRYHVEMLKHEFGDRNVVDIRASGFDMLKSCDRVYCCTNSELGIIGMLLDKEVSSVEKNDSPEKFGGFESIYKATNYKKENLLMLLSCKYSGIINVGYQFQERMFNFFQSFNYFMRNKDENSD